MKWLILLSGILSNAGASVLIKVAMLPPYKPTSLNPLVLLSNLPLIVGVMLYGVAFVLYALALTKLPLNVAHPILTSGAIALVAAVSTVYFGERLSPLNWLGIGLIICGVIALTAD